MRQEERETRINKRVKQSMIVKTMLSFDINPQTFEKHDN